MASETRTSSIAPAIQPRERIAGALVLCVLALACTGFWVGVPAAFLWALGGLTDSGTTHFVVALLGIPLAMAAYSPLLIWLNGLYLRVTGVLRRFEGEGDWGRRVRGPLEPLLLGSLAIELAALCVWFFFIAEQPPRIII